MESIMRPARVLHVLVASVVWSASLSGQAPATPVASCAPVGPVKFVCGQAGPEDLVAVPNTRWLIASAFGGDGGLFLIDTRAASSTKISAATVAIQIDDELWAGSFRGDRIARYPARGLR